MMRNYLRVQVYAFLCLLLIFSGCTTGYEPKQLTDFNILYGPSQPKQRVLSSEELTSNLALNAISYEKDIKPILDTRCVACHACYDAPCQLKLGSTAGIDRGATKKLVYDGGRLKGVDPTRLFIDAVDTQGWRDKDFYPVLNERRDSAQAALNNSLLAKLIQLKRDHPLPESGKLASSFKLDLGRTLECPTVSEFEDYQNKYPAWGMPYGMPGLTLKQEYTIMQWLQHGAKFMPQPPISAQSIQLIQQWETFFNRPSLKQKLVSRYIYEHLFIGHIHFQGQPNDEFFHLVRSVTPPGQAVQEIATRLPYEDPKVAQFYYRLRPIQETIVDKTHFVYEFSDKKMQRYEELFFLPEYSVVELPSYQDRLAANPFKAFIVIPRNSRYQFLLDNAQYFVTGFIKGPVCRGQVALDVIRDRFWVVFTNPVGPKNQPDKDEEINQFMANQDTNLSLPGSAGKSLGLFGFEKYNALAEQYLKDKDTFGDHFITEYGGFNMTDLWNGNGGNLNAALTVFRHEDSATVVKGLVGDTPLTAWVVDYPLLERIHYLLVAGYDVYSSINHQLASRSYMDFLRVDGENNFLRFMPMDQRQTIHKSWYKGLSGKLVAHFEQAYYNKGFETGMQYQSTHYKQEFFAQMKKYLGNAEDKQYKLMNCMQEACIDNNLSSHQQEVNQHLGHLSQLKGSALGVFPEMSLLRVRGAKGEVDQVFTVLFNKALENVAIIIAEDLRREPELDTLTVVPGFIGSYPNFFFNIDQQQLPAFINTLKNARTQTSRDAFYSQYGVRRTHPDFWSYVDWFNEQHKRYRGERAGLLDLNRYQNL